MNIEILERDRRRLRREVLVRRVLHALEGTIQLRPKDCVPDLTSVSIDIDVDFTDKSVRVLAPLVEAVEILEDIIFASDGCMGHAQCVHSMEPWKRARALLGAKWEAEIERQPWPAGTDGSGEVA